MSSEDFPDPDPDRPGRGEPARGHRCGDDGEVGLGRGQELAAVVCSFVGQGGITAGDEAFPGVVRVGDLGQVGLIEQGLLHRPVSERVSDGLCKG